MDKNRFWKTPEEDSQYNWKLVRINPNGIVVSWQEKYGDNVSKTCIGLWETDKQYMLTNKDSSKTILEKSNINSLTVNNVET